MALCEDMDNEATIRAVRADALAVLLERSDVEELRAALTDVCAGRLHANAVLRWALVQGTRSAGRSCKDRAPHLTARQLEALCWQLHHARYSGTAIAERMHMELTSLKTHLRAARAKFKVRTSVEAARRAEELGLFDYLPVFAGGHTKRKRAGDGDRKHAQGSIPTAQVSTMTA